MKTSERIFLFDLDSSLADFDFAMREKLRAMMSPGDLTLDWSKFTIDDSTRPDWLTARERTIKKVPGFWIDLAPIEFGIKLFHMAGTLDYRRVVLTKGPRKNSLAWKEKLDWCALHIPDVEDITICTDKGLTYGKVLYDDYPPYILRWLEWRPRGKVLMLDAPHNREFQHPSVMRVFRDNFEGQQEAILEFLGDL